LSRTGPVGYAALPLHGEKTSVPVAGHEGIAENEYRRRINAWAMYDWANSAFSTTILAAVLPVYYSRVAGSTLASESIATAYWTIGLSVALFTIAILSPILGTISDIRRGKKPLLAVFVGMGVVATGLLVFVGSGDWLLASILFVVGRIGFGGANIFYDALLPHVARDEDQDRVSSLGYAVGYVGGGLLLVVNTVMIFVLGEIPGSRLSFLSVAIWWAVFTIPVLRRVPEPPAATIPVEDGGSIVRAGFGRLRDTFSHIRRYRELFKYLVAFLIYNDGIGTIIGVAAIYGAELGFGAEELILALVMVQFAAFPFTLAFGRIPGGRHERAPVFLAFVVLSLVALPAVGAIGARTLDADLVGRPGPDFETVDGAVGMDEYEIGHSGIVLDGDWTVVAADDLDGAESDYAFSTGVGNRVDFRYNGREVEITYGRGPDHGEWAVEIDGEPVLDDGEPLLVDGYNEADRYRERETVDAGEAGVHVLSLINTGTADVDSTGTVMAIGPIEVLEPTREAALGTLLGLLLLVQVAVGLVSWAVGPRLFGGIGARMDTKRTILLALTVYAVIAVWGFFLDTVIEFWYLAWMVAIVQGGSQALSRSLYASMSPASMSGEFFGFFSIMAKFSAFIGPIVFAGTIALFGSSRPAVLAVVTFFVVGGYLLSRVDVEEGRRAAREADRAGEA
jgi:UMF1 family MFS transporter